jgi:hypothetical protein
VNRWLIGLSLGLVAFRVLSAAFVVIQPGFTDAYYYVDVARRFAHGQGLTADFIWNFLEAPRLDPLPVPSHRFWMPLTSIVQGSGIWILEPLLGTFRSAQAAIVAVAAFVPPATYAAARSIGASSRAALVAAALAGIGGGAFAPAWVTLDSFAIAALVGTMFFVAFARAAAGDLRAGAISGVLVGLLFLARAESALFGVALLALAVRPVSRAPGIAGSAVALAIGGGWLARGIALGGSPDLLGGTVLLARYEDFFAINPTGTADLATIVSTRLGALWSDLIVALFGLMVFLAFPLALGVRAAWGRPAVRAFVGLVLLIYVAQGVIWPLHATRGSYFHSLAAFYPYAMALVALGGEAWLARRDERARRLAVYGTIFAALSLALVGLTTWDGAFNAGYRVRLDAVNAIPAGPFLAIDGAAWRWIADRPALVTPADGTDMAACVAKRYGAKSVVLEAAHFSAYDGLYRGDQVRWLGPPVERGTVRIYPVVGDVEVLCSLRASPDTDRAAGVP